MVQDNESGLEKLSINQSIYAVPGTLQPVHTGVTGTKTMPGRTGQERPSG